MKSYNEIAQSVLERRDEYEKAHRAKRKKLITVSSVVSCLVVVAVIGMGIGKAGFFKKPGIGPEVTNAIAHSMDVTGTTYITEQTTTGPATTIAAINPETEEFTQALTTTTGSELYYEIDWDRKSMPGKYCAVILERGEYFCYGEYVYPFGPIEERTTTRKTTEIISDKQIEQYEPDGTLHTTVVDIFALEGLSEELAVGVRFENDKRIYTYVNNSYIPETLGEFLNAIDYDNTVNYGGIMLYPGNKFPVNNENAADIKNYLLSDAGLVNIRDTAVTGKSVTATISCHELGLEYKVLTIFEDGYLSTNLIGYEYVFYVGKEAVANFLKDSYNITFEQIKELTAVTMSTAPTTEDVRTSVWTGALPHDENAGSEIDATVTGWCGTGMEGNANVVVGTTEKIILE